MHQSNVAGRESLLEWQSRPTAACATSTCISHCHLLLTMCIYSGLLNVCPIPERNQDIAAISLAATTEVRRKIGGGGGGGRQRWVFSLVSLCPESAEQTLLVLVTSMNSRPKAKRYGRTVPDKSTRAENLLIFFSDTGMPFPFLSPDILTFYR